MKKVKAIIERDENGTCGVRAPELENVIIGSGDTLAEKITDMKMRLQDILLSISWRELSTHYFGKSCSWLYHKLDGIDGNGKQDGFTPEEAEQLKSALNDLADRIRRAADSI